MIGFDDPIGETLSFWGYEGRVHIHVIFFSYTLEIRLSIRYFLWRIHN